MDKVCKYGKDDRPIVLFGAGEIGKNAVNILGDKVAFFVDNNAKKIGELYCNKQVISFEEYLKNADKHHCIVSAREEYAIEIEKQLHKEGIDGHILFIKN